MTIVQAVLWGCLGGVMPDVLRLIAARYGSAPDYLSKWFFWVSLCLLVAVAAFTTYLLAPQRIIDAIAIGFSAPEILSNALGKRDNREIRDRRATAELIEFYLRHRQSDVEKLGRPLTVEEIERDLIPIGVGPTEVLNVLRRWWGRDQAPSIGPWRR
jgi:hypothetical protein